MKMKRQLRLLLVFVLVLSSVMMYSSSPTQAQTSAFSDVPTSHWAYQHVLKMQLREVITGYEDGTFRPNRNVTQLEAVIMAIRNMGLEDEAQSKNTSSYNLSPYDLPEHWNAAGYVALAIDHQLIDTDNFHSSRSASRAWTAQLLIRMLDLEDELPSGSSTSFADDASIPSAYKSYAALINEKEIITGIKNRSGQLEFQPNTVVTRGQLATMISRSERYMSGMPGQLPVVNVESVQSNQLRVKDQNGSDRSYVLSSDAVYYDDNESMMSSSQLSAGQAVKVGINENGQVVYVEFVSHAPIITSYEGTVVQHFMNDGILTIRDEDGELEVYQYTSDLSVTNASSQDINADTLSAGDQISYTLDSGNMITTIEVSSTSNGSLTSGIIFALDLELGLLTLENNGRYAAYSLADHVSVEYEGIRFATVRDLTIGDEVQVSATNQEVNTIKLITPYDVEDLVGEIVSVSERNRIITVTLDNGSVRAFEVPSTTEIEIDGVTSATFEDLKEADQISIKVENDQVTYLEVLNRNFEDELKGTVKSIDYSNQLITIETVGNQLEVYRYDSFIQLDLDMTRPEPEDIVEGMRVSIVTQDGKITSLTLDHTIEGTFLRTSSNESHITVRLENGDQATYPLARSYDIDIANISRADISDLERNQEVVLELDLDVVTDIDVKVTDTYEITKVNTTRNRITILKDDDDSTHSVSRNTEIVIPNVKNPDIDDLNDGDIVQLDFTGDTLDKITVIPPMYGFVSSIELYRNQMTIKSVDGEVTYDTNDAEAYNDDGRKVSLSTISTNDYVQVIDNGEDVVFHISEKVTGTLSYLDLNNGRIYVQDQNNMYNSYFLLDRVVAWQDNEVVNMGDLEEENHLTLHLFDNRVYVIIVD